MSRLALLSHPPFAARVATGAVVTAIEETRRLPSVAIALPMTALSQAFQVAMRVQQGIAELAIKGDETLDVLFGTQDDQPEWARFDDIDSYDAEAFDEIVVFDVRYSDAYSETADSDTAGSPTSDSTDSDESDYDEYAAEAADLTTGAQGEVATAHEYEGLLTDTDTADTETADAESADPGTAGSAPAATGRFALYSSAPVGIDPNTGGFVTGGDRADAAAADDDIDGDILDSDPSDGDLLDEEAAGKAQAAEAEVGLVEDEVPIIVAELDYDELTLAQLRAKLRSVSADDLVTLAQYERDHRARAPFLTMLDNRVMSAQAKRDAQR